MYEKFKVFKKSNIQKKCDYRNLSVFKDIEK